MVQRRIAVDARPLLYPNNGNGRYMHKMLQALIRQRPDYEWLLFAPRPLDLQYSDLLLPPSVTLHVEPGWPLPLPGPLWLNFTLPRLVRRYEADLLWESLAILPLFWSRRRNAVPALLNFHDLNARIAPDTMLYWNRLQHRLLNNHSLAEASLVACLSETTRSDLLRFLPAAAADPEKLIVVYPGYEVSAVESRAPRSAELKGQLEKRGFFLSVGTLEPRKNQTRLIEAWQLMVGSLPPKERNNGPLLLFAGRKGWQSDALYEQLKGEGLTSAGVWFLESPAEEELAWCYENCRALILPSLHEGFGLPVIEARSFGKSALLSDIAIFREIAGPDDLFADPCSVSAWRERLLELRKVRPAPARPTTILRRKGRANDEWSWSQRAHKLATLFDRLATTKDDKKPAPPA